MLETDSDAACSASAAAKSNSDCNLKLSAVLQITRASRWWLSLTVLTISEQLPMMKDTVNLLYLHS